MMKKKYLGPVTARGGSKRIPMKNTLVELNGTPPLIELANDLSEKKEFRRLWVNNE